MKKTTGRARRALAAAIALSAGLSLAFAGAAGVQALGQAQGWPAPRPRC